MTTTKRYRLPDALGGGVHEAHHDQAMYPKVCFELGLTGPLWLHRKDLTEVAPPVPDEPKAEPGKLAYFVDRYGLPWRNSIHHGKWESAGTAPTAWHDLWNSAGPLTRLIPDPAHGVTLPWLDTDHYWLRVQVSEGAVVAGLGSGNGHLRLTPDHAERWAGALLAAARTVREATP